MCQITKNDSTIAFWEFDAVLYQETILSSGVFRRETASGFYPFGDATALAGEGGVRGVVWLIQASASNHKPKGPSLWFVVYVVCLKSDIPQH